MLHIINNFFLCSKLLEKNNYSILNTILICSIKMSIDIFISYNWDSSDLVDKLYDKLVGLNLNVWRDIKNLNQTNEPLTFQLGTLF